MRRVVVTGLGMVTPLGVGTGPTWEAILAGKSGVGPITRFDASQFPTTIAAEIKGFVPEDFVDRKEIKRMDRFIHLAMASAHLAMEDAGLSIDGELAPRAGVFMGSGLGGLSTLERYHQAYLEEGVRKISPFFIPMLISNLAPGHIAIRYGAKGPNITTTTACAASSHAVGEALMTIRRGVCDVVIAGGSEATITPMGLGGFCAMKALSSRNGEPEKASRPFDKDRDGFVMGEGAAILILEELEFARKRGAKIYAELSGYGASGDAHHVTAPPPGGEGAVRCMRAALEDARVRAEEVEYINAHGTSTPYNDQFETMAIKTVFGERARNLMVSSTKSMTGHLLGAAGAIEGAFCVLALRDGVIPPTINYTTPDPECDLDYVPNAARRKEIRYALSNSFGFGGTNSCLLFGRFSG
ncbi:MAG TPA: beta-ketoacyl-[acyl-carrier-protein] synthase II [Deltaproteobacteria bacterium]|nr:MAG: beta-ketoacyl-[acyl-carrier-protein] synthase II [Deltaproteobacteria bacterium GWC2_65_14]HBO69764.1 beta-ketoacyl-[acyl-carrier-protein] synthase II [Deltaproteobacteria bacterium]